MTGSHKETVALSQIVPGQNPRRDFGDIDALAGAIAATGGQPVNPPVVVADGGVYRLVDGERRYRALRRLHGEDGMADVLVFDDYGEAEEAVAMMATDAKQELTEEERARGFQRMLLLGVEERTIAKAARRKVSDVRKAASVAKDAPEQATLDQMIAAAEFEGKDRAAVLNAAPDKWRMKAETIRRRIARDEVRAEFMEAIGRVGAEACKDKPDGYRSLVTAYTPAELERVAGEHVGEELAAWPCPWCDSYWYLGAPVTCQEAVETDEERAARELRERRQAAVEGLRSALLRDIATTDIMPKAQRVAGRLRPHVYSYERDSLRRNLVEELGVRAEIADECVFASDASMYELAQLVRQNSLHWWHWVAEIVPAACDDGFSMSEEDAWLLELARCERERSESSDEDGDE